MRSNPTVIVKVPEGSLRESNQKGLINEFLFWCTIKTINPEGFIKRGQVIKCIREKTSLSEANIRLKLSKLEKLSWLKRSSGSICLSKYDVVWKSIGIVKECQDGKKVFKVQSGNYKQIRERIELEEIKYCLRKQYFKVSTSFVNQELGEDTVRKPSVRAKISKKLLKSIDFSKLFFLQVKNILKKPSKLNYDISLSCLGTAKLFGYESAMQGYLIQQRLKASGYIDIERRVMYIGKGSGYCDLPSGFFISNGKILRQLPNKITIK